MHLFPQRRKGASGLPLPQKRTLSESLRIFLHYYWRLKHGKGKRESGGKATEIEKEGGGKGGRRERERGTDRKTETQTET